MRTRTGHCLLNTPSLHKLRSGQLHAIAAKMNAGESHGRPATGGPDNIKPWTSKGRESIVGPGTAGGMHGSSVVNSSFKSKASGHAAVQQAKRRMANQASRRTCAVRSSRQQRL